MARIKSINAFGLNRVECGLLSGLLLTNLVCIENLTYDCHHEQ